MREQTDDARDPVGWALSLAAMLRRLRELEATIDAIASADDAGETTTPAG